MQQGSGVNQLDYRAELDGGRAAIPRQLRGEQQQEGRKRFPPLDCRYWPMP